MLPFTPAAPLSHASRSNSHSSLTPTTAPYQFLKAQLLGLSLLPPTRYPSDLLPGAGDNRTRCTWQFHGDFTPVTRAT